MTEEPEIYEPNFIFFKRIFEAFKVPRAADSRGRTEQGRGRERERWDEEGILSVLDSGTREGPRTAVSMLSASSAH